MPSHDTNGREYAKLSELKPGDRIQFGSGFKCVDEGENKEVHEFPNLGKCVACDYGIHNLDGQLADDNDHLIGVYHVK